MAGKTPAEEPGDGNPAPVETDPSIARQSVLDDPELSSEDYMRASSDSEYLTELVEKRHAAGGEAQAGEGEGEGEAQPEGGRPSPSPRAKAKEKEKEKARGRKPLPAMAMAMASPRARSPSHAAGPVTNDAPRRCSNKTTR